MRFLQTAIAACILASLALPGLAQEDLAALNSRVAELYGKGDFAGAMKVAKQVVETAERQLGPDHPDTASSLNILAFLFSTQGQFAEAKPLLKRSLAIREKTLGPDHTDTAHCLNNLARIYENEGQYAQAEPLYKRSLAIYEKTLGPDDPKTAKSLNDLALLYEKQGHYASAEPLFKRALAIREKTLGPDHPDTAQSLNNLETHYKRSLEICEKHLGPDHPDTKLCRENLAKLHSQQADQAAKGPLVQNSPAEDVPAAAEPQEDLASLNSRVEELYGKGDFAGAIKVAKQLEEAAERQFGPDHPHTAWCLNALAGLYLDQGQAAAAEPLYKRALAIREKFLGPDHSDTASSLNNLAGLYRYQGEYAEAEPLYKRALAICEKTLGPDHPNTATSLNNLAVIYEDQGQVTEAEPLLKRVLAIREKTLGPDHPDTASSLNNLAVNYKAQGQYTEAEPVCKRALSIREKALGPDHPDTAQSLINLALLYEAQGQYAEAEPLYKRALAIREKALGPNHPDTARSLNFLAGLYRDLRQLAQGELYSKRALAIREKTLGPDHPDTAASVDVLAAIYDDQGMHAQAEPLIKRSLAIREKTLGPDHPDTAVSLNNLAANYADQRQFAKAEQLFKRALAIREKTLGPDHPDTAKSLNNLAGNYEDLGRYAEAEPLLKRALAITEKSLGPDHPDTAGSLNQLACVYRCRGHYAQAAPLLIRSLAIYNKSFGPDHPYTAGALRNLASEQAATEDWLAAVDSIDRARHGVRRYVARVLPSLSDREQIQFLKVSDDGNLHSALSIGLAKADDPKIVALSAGWLANAKSVGQEAAAERILIAREGNNSSAKKLADELTAVRRQLAALRQAVTAAAESQDILKKIGELEEQERSLIRSLGAAVPWVEKDDPWVGIDAIRRAIPAGTVFVDIARFAVFDFGYVAREGTPYDPFLPARYAAWIVPPAGAGDVRVIDLGDATRIDGLVDEVRSLLNAHSEAKGAIATKGEGAAEKELAAATAPLSQLTIQPILRAATASLGAAPKELVISADGKLWLVPFAALPLEDGRYAIEATAIRLVTSGRDLVDPAAAERRSAAVGKPLIMAAPDFDNESAGRAADQRSDNRGVSSFSRPIAAHRLPKVGALPGTLDEAMAVAPSVGRLADSRPEVVTGGDATEARFKTTPRPIVAILATHGFFLPDQQIDRKLLAAIQGSDGGGRGLADSRGEALENPLTRCGLLFAGCNRANAADAAANATEDGVLTGLEIIGCDLRGTKLVVLSACQTGLGDVEAGQGVAGLRQAFQLAGARSVVATLWSVPDRETAELSSGMFANLADGKTTSDSLRQAQIDMIASRRRLLETAHPFFWAAFTVTGK